MKLLFFAISVFVVSFCSNLVFGAARPTDPNTLVDTDNSTTQAGWKYPGCDKCAELFPDNSTNLGNTKGVLNVANSQKTNSTENPRDKTGK